MREVTGTIVRPDGSPIVDTYVEFILTDLFGKIVNSYDTETNKRVSSRCRTMTDANGHFSVTVEENDRLDGRTAYIVRVHDEDVRDFMVAVFAGEAPIDWMDLKRYGNVYTANFDGVVYTTYPSIDGTKYRFDCEMVGRIIDYIGGGSGEDNASIIPEFVDYFIAYEEGVWQREDMEALDALMAAMVTTEATCQAIQGG